MVSNRVIAVYAFLSLPSSTHHGDPSAHAEPLDLETAIPDTPRYIEKMDLSSQDNPLTSQISQQILPAKRWITSFD